MQFQSQRLVMLQTHTYVTADLYDKQPDKPRIVRFFVYEQLSI